MKSAITFGFFDGLLVYHLRIVIIHIRLSGCVFKLVENAEAQVVLEFPMENMQLPMNYFKLECYLLSFRIAELYIIIYNNYIIYYIIYYYILYYNIYYNYIIYI